MITSDTLSKFSSLRFAMSLRVGGVSPEPFGMNMSFQVGDEAANVVENRKRFLGPLGFDDSGIAIPRQCHSSNVQVVTKPGQYDSCDGLITDIVGLPLVVTVADCLPIVLHDPEKRVIGIVHAGWRGTVQGIAAEALRVMAESWGTTASDVIAYLGPAAGVCCYEVGSDVTQLFSLDEIEQRNDRLYLNLQKSNVHQLLGCGVQEESIEVSPLCTICHPEFFHSFRRDKARSGRMMALVSLVEHTD